jgi:hypothetical protein
MIRGISRSTSTILPLKHSTVSEIILIILVCILFRVFLEHLCKIIMVSNSVAAGVH